MYKVKLIKQHRESTQQKTDHLLQKEKTILLKRMVFSCLGVELKTYLRLSIIVSATFAGTIS